MFFWSYRKYDMSPKATRLSSALHCWPLNVLSWILGTVGLIVTGFFVYAMPKEIAFYIFLLICIISLWYAVTHKKRQQLKLIKALEKDCPDLFTQEERESIREENYAAALSSFLIRNNKYI